MINTCNKGKEILVLVDVETKDLKVLTNPDMDTNDFIAVRDIVDDYVFVVSSSFNQSASTYILTDFNSETPKWTKICKIDVSVPSEVSSKSPLPKSTKNYEYLQKVISHIKVDTLTSEEGAEGYFIRVVDNGDIFENAKRPTILLMHGGPHGSFPMNVFLKEKILWLSLGYNIFSVNYRGSTGYGLKFCEALAGNVFTMDVNDCLNLFQKCIDTYPEEVDDTRLGVYGGSHGGFLTCSVISHPDWADRFKAACIWNPVTAMHSTVSFSDIPDWHYAVACNKPNTWIPSKEDIMEMYDRSPISRLANVKTPSLFIIGGDDRRVPDKQGIHFYRGLKELGVETDLHYYPNDGHTVASLEENIDAMMNMVRWWVDHL